MHTLFTFWDSLFNANYVVHWTTCGRISIGIYSVYTYSRDIRRVDLYHASGLNQISTFGFCLCVWRKLGSYCSNMWKHVWTAISGKKNRPNYEVVRKVVRIALNNWVKPHRNCGWSYRSQMEWVSALFRMMCNGFRFSSSSCIQNDHRLTNVEHIPELQSYMVFSLFSFCLQNITMLVRRQKTMECAMYCSMYYVVYKYCLRDICQYYYRKFISYSKICVFTQQCKKRNILRAYFMMQKY